MGVDVEVDVFDLADLFAIAIDNGAALPLFNAFEQSVRHHPLLERSAESRCATPAFRTVKPPPGVNGATVLLRARGVVGSRMQCRRRHCVPVRSTLWKKAP